MQHGCDLALGNHSYADIQYNCMTDSTTKCDVPVYYIW